MRRRLSVLPVLFLTACASIQFAERQDVDTLYFGTARQAGVVSETEWNSFVDEVLSRQYPEFTEWTATGHWRGAEEATHVVQLVHRSWPSHDTRIQQIIDEYKRRFGQESVLWVRGRGFVAPQ